jgi:pyruvate,orthophosphate dikinase
MYGSYREEKLEAMGLALRVESLGTALIDRVIAVQDPQWTTRGTLQKVLAWLRLLRRALWIDGFRARGLSAGIEMLEQALASERTSLAQYVNIFQVLSRAVEQIVRVRFLEVYEVVIRRIVPRMLERGVLRGEEGDDADETLLKLSEGFLRNLIAESFGLQQVDLLVARVLRSLARARDSLEPAKAELLVGYDAEPGFVDIEERPGPCDGAMNLGNKGMMLKRLAGYGLPVPHGFILTGEIFRCRPAFEDCPELADDFEARLRQRLGRIERLTDSRFGDPRRPLLLSVRSSSAISMPGVLDTFLNVGINAEIVEGVARRSGSDWAAWDAYRRFLQLWGMGFGLDRVLFDVLIRDTKQRYGAEKKAHLTPEKMRELALLYRDLVRDHGIEIEEEPFAQLSTCVDLVLRSWDAEKARVYRGELQIAEEWGTAVIVQSMVYGNLHQRSGTGVVMTSAPKGRPQDVGLFGDFTVQSQGDDVVSGLVETFPIGADERPATMSLEGDFPAIHAELVRHARLLVHDLGMFHQEIEFTFESEDPADLYVLQTRDCVMATITAVAAFVRTPELERAKVAAGIGAGGGALSGRVAHTARDVEELRRRFPDDPIILLRPDTVPDDIPLVLRCEGMVTALGGATSHAALVAQRLGRTCVVGCRQLDVSEEEGLSHIGGHAVATGEILSINGIDGSVYLGSHPTTTVRRQKLV